MAHSPSNRGRHRPLWSVCVPVAAIVTITGMVGNDAAAQAASEPLSLPNGTYRAERGYHTPRGALCLASHPPVDVRVLDGTISFVSDDFNWDGTVNQKTGYINIPDDRIRHRRTGDQSKQGLSISGDFRNAELTSGTCGKGFFRLVK
jgi:hypothetical protein